MLYHFRDTATSWSKSQILHTTRIGYGPAVSLQHRRRNAPILPATAVAAMSASGTHPGRTGRAGSEATTDAQRQLCTYVRTTWVQSAVWPPSAWSVFYRAVRSNNDVEGWHRRLNAKASRGSLNLYLLMLMLAAESQLVNIQLILLKESHRIRRQCRASRTTTARLFKLWGRLTSKERTARQILRAASHIFPM